MSRMNGKPFTAEEDAIILEHPHFGFHRLAGLLKRPLQSVRDRRLKLFDYDPPRVRG